MSYREEQDALMAELEERTKHVQLQEWVHELMELGLNPAGLPKFLKVAEEFYATHRKASEAEAKAKAYEDLAYCIEQSRAANRK